MNRSEWGVLVPGRGWQWEEDVIGAARPPTPTADNNAQERAVLLVDKDGKPLIVRQPRPVGFRKL